MKLGLAGSATEQWSRIKWILQNQKSAARLEPKHSSVLAVSSTLFAFTKFHSSLLTVSFQSLVRVAQYAEMSLAVDF